MYSQFKIIFTFFSISLLLLSCAKEEEVKEIIRPVRYEQVFMSGGSRLRSFAGVVQAGTKSNLSFKVPGTVQRLAVAVGDKVRRGQTLAQLDAVDYKIQVKEAENARDQARAQEIQALANYERMQSLYENRSISRSELEAARAAYETAHEQDNITKKRRKLAQNQLDYTSLTAPMAGAISDLRIEVNENVKSGETVLVLTSGSQLEVKIGMPEILISQVKEGSDVTVTLDAVAGKNFAAIVTEVGVASTGFATTYPVTVRFEENDPSLRAGMAAEVTFTFESESQRNCFIVPPLAVGEDRLGRYVFIVEKSEPGLGIVQKKAVETGELTTDGLEIFEGLKDGEYLVIAGVSKLKDSLRVKFTPEEE